MTYLANEPACRTGKSLGSTTTELVIMRIGCVGSLVLIHLKTNTHITLPTRYTGNKPIAHIDRDGLEEAHPEKK